MLRLEPFSHLEPVFRAADLIVHHGGHGTALIGLQSGTPVIVLPTLEVDRADTAVRLENTGTARFYDTGDKRGTFPELVNEVLMSDKMRASAAELAERAFAKRGPGRAYGVIAEWIAES